MTQTSVVYAKTIKPTPQNLRAHRIGMIKMCPICVKVMPQGTKCVENTLDHIILDKNQQCSIGEACKCFETHKNNV